MTRVLVELRPAFEGLSGIPQETRLLFAGLAGTPSVDACGLLQRGGGIVAPGVPADADGGERVVSAALRAQLLDDVVRSLGPRPTAGWWPMLLRKVRSLMQPMMVVLLSCAGRRIRLGYFDPTGSEDSIWRAMFAATLPSADRPVVLSACYRILRWPWSTLHAIGVLTSFLGRPLYPKLDTTGIDVVIGETPFPARVKPPTRLVVRYHDTFPMSMTRTVKRRGYHGATHRLALRRNVRDGAWFACVSEATRRELMTFEPQLAARAVTIPNMISRDFHDDTGPIEKVAGVWEMRRNLKAPCAGGRPFRGDGAAPPAYLLAVGTIEPRKNHSVVVEAWRRLCDTRFPSLQLVLVGHIGWGSDAILEHFVPWLRQGGLHLLCDVPVDELRLLYRHAAVTVCASLGEGFDYPGVEAMRCGGVVAASDLPVHREVLEDGCVYFDPSSSDRVAATLAPLLEAGAVDRRRALADVGRRVAARYLPERVIPQWTAFLTSVAGR